MMKCAKVLEKTLEGPHTAVDMIIMPACTATVWKMQGSHTTKDTEEVLLLDSMIRRQINDRHTHLSPGKSLSTQIFLDNPGFYRSKLNSLLSTALCSL